MTPAEREVIECLEEFVEGFGVLHSALKQSNYPESVRAAWIETFDRARAAIAKATGEA